MAALTVGELDCLETQMVHALLPGGTLKARWQATPLLPGADRTVVGARWELDDKQVGPLTFQKGDLCLEYYSSEESFNIIELRGAKGLKGWYINLATPAVFTGGKITYTDLALDFAVTPDGAVLELDKPAFQQLLEEGILSEVHREGVLRAVAHLRHRLARGGAPSWLRSLYRRAAQLPGEEHLLDMVRTYGLPPALFTGGPGLAVAMTDFWVEGMARGTRVAEAIFALHTGEGGMLVHGKSFYPDGVLRLPGGGIEAGEPPDEAAVREAMEETGLPSRPVGFIGYMRSLLLAGGDQVPLTVPTYIFKLESLERGREPVPQAEEDITVLQPVSPHGLDRMTRRLEGLTGSWMEWGRYRALQHRVALRGLEK